MPIVTLGRRFLSNAPAVDVRTIFYDADLKGFGLSVSPSSAKAPKGTRTWIVEYRLGAGGRRATKKRVSIGSAWSVPPESARKQAGDILAMARLGQNTSEVKREARQARTIAELHPIYTKATDGTRKDRTVTVYDGYWRLWILPALGKKAARDVTLAAIRKLHSDIGTTHKITANRVVTNLTHFFRWAEESGYLGEGTSPVRRFTKFKEEARSRYLSDDELSRLGAAIREAETVGIPWTSDSPRNATKRPENTMIVLSPYAAGALRLLLFTGARLREILHLRWCDVDMQRGLLNLPDSKTGKKTIVLSGPALAVVEQMRAQADSDDNFDETVSRIPMKDQSHIIRGADKMKPRADLKRPWLLVTERAGLSGVRLHDIRHTFASKGAEGGMGLPIIGKLLGHASTATTARYAHLDSDPLRRATNTISGSIAEALLAEVSDNVRPLARGARNV